MEVLGGCDRQIRRDTMVHPINITVVCQCLPLVVVKWEYFEICDMGGGKAGQKGPRQGV